jgi:hypothetical protein
MDRKPLFFGSHSKPPKDKQGAETGVLGVVGSNSSFSYKALLDHHVTGPNNTWAGFMAGAIVDGQGFFNGAYGVVTFTARQVDSSECTPESANCYVKFVSVQMFL